jgi:hypothetical protein
MAEWLAVKAVDGSALELDVLGLPYGGPNGGKDADGEYFAEDTNTHEDKYPLPPVVYYHGLDDAGKPAGAPAYIGKTVRRWRDAAGEWFRVVLDDANDLARRVWEAAKNGAAAASSGSVGHLWRKHDDGHIYEWPLVELSLFETTSGKRPANRYAVVLPVMKAVYDAAGLSLPAEIEPPEAKPGAGEPAAKAGADVNDSNPGDDNVDEMETKINDAVSKALDAYKAREDERARAEAARKAEVDAAIEAALKAERDKQAAERRLPGGAPYVTKFNDQKFDSLAPEDMAFMVGTLNAAVKSRTGEAPTELALKSLALKMGSDEAKDSQPARLGLKALTNVAGRALKSDEIMQQDLANYGDDWVGVAYSQRMWEAIRHGTFVVDNLPAIEVPQGNESITIPLEAGNPTFYKVAEATSLPTTEATGWPNATITSSQIGTAKKSISLAKMGCRVLWSGELNEDSLIPFVPQLRRQIERAGAEQMEHAIIDGDTTDANTTNINDIAGDPAGTELFLLVDGFRKLPLVTNTANARDASGLTVEDFLETLKLMGVAGGNAVDFDAVDFIIDPWVHWKALELPEVKSRDVFSAPTLERGVLTGLYGHKVRVSRFMCYSGVLAGTVTTDTYKLKSQSADGKIDQDTEADNVDGSILAVRWDQWLMAWRRRMTMETTRIARADTTEIVMLARWGLGYRDTEASAISYGVTV